MNKNGEKKERLLSENWDSDPSASDDESFELEMTQDENLRNLGSNKEKTRESK